MGTMGSAVLWRSFGWPVSPACRAAPPDRGQQWRAPVMWTGGSQRSRRLMMRPAMHHLSISAIQADALFVSALQRADHPSAREVRQAVATAVGAFGQRGCAGRVAQEFGDHPETAVT